MKCIFVISQFRPWDKLAVHVNCCLPAI